MGCRGASILRVKEVNSMRKIIVISGLCLVSLITLLFYGCGGGVGSYGGGGGSSSSGIATNITITPLERPADLAGHTILADGVATKQFVSDDSQHLAGTKGKESKDNPKQSLKFEVSGLMVQ